MRQGPRSDTMVYCLVYSNLSVVCCVLCLFDIFRDLAKKILVIGKSINFIRQCCGNTDVRTDAWISDNVGWQRLTEQFRMWLCLM